MGIFENTVITVDMNLRLSFNKDVRLNDVFEDDVVPRNMQKMTVQEAFENNEIGFNYLFERALFNFGHEKFNKEAISVNITSKRGV